MKKEHLYENKSSANPTSINRESLDLILKKKTQQQKNVSIAYFWASFVLQIIVYSLLSHVIIKYWNDSTLVWISFSCIFIYIPFTIVLLKYFKRIATIRAKDSQGNFLPMNEYIRKHHLLLSCFYKFKKRYEFLLIIVSTAIMTWIVFRIYVPGGIAAHPVAAGAIYTFSVVACAITICQENTRNFKRPLDQLELLLEEYKQ